MAVKFHKKPRKPKKFRSQLLAEWLVENYKPCKAADIGGGKGLLAYLLNQHGWDVTVIDPEYQDLPTKYTGLDKQRVKIPPEATVEHIDETFEKEMTKDFDMIIGLHVHGSCMKMIEAAKEYNKKLVLLPCCVIDEPIIKEEGIKWTESLVEYAEKLGLEVQTTKLNFKGKNVVIYNQRSA
jgi:hypothetical protein